MTPSIGCLVIIVNKWKQPKYLSADEDKHNVVHPHNGMLLSHKNERTTGTCYNMDGPKKHAV